MYFRLEDAKSAESRILFEFTMIEVWSLNSFQMSNRSFLHWLIGYKCGISDIEFTILSEEEDASRVGSFVAFEVAILNS